MALKVPVVGRQPLLNYLIGALGDSLGVNLHLFKSNITPANGDVLSDYTSPHEADFGGYAPIAIANIDWSAAGLDGSDRAFSTAPLQTFTQDGGGSSNTIYGYFVTDSTDADLLWAERDPAAPVTVDATHRVYAVVPKFTLTTEF